MTGLVTSTNFVGREHELGRLQRGLRSAAAGTPGVLLVAGEAGVGKTRLVQEFAGRAGDEAQVLLGSCVNVSGGGLPYGPIVDALRAPIRTPDPAIPQALVGTLLGELTSKAPATAPPSVQEPSELTGEYARARLFELVLRLLDRLGERAPVVMVLEDLHWADRSTLDLLVFLAGVVRQERLLLVATYRSDELPASHPVHAVMADLNRNRHVEHLQLPRFERQETAALLHGILGRPPLPETVERIFVQSEGNAFLAEELMAATGEQSDPHRSARLQGLLLARIAPLPEDTQHVLRLAATVRRPVTHQLLATASQLTEEQLLAAIREAVDQQVLLGEQDSYAFRHVLLQEAVYDQLLPGERQRLHRAVARALGQDPLAASHPGAAVELSHHWYAARDYPHALRASITAARTAADVYGFTEARHQYERALTMWPQVPQAHQCAGVAFPELLLEAAETAHWVGAPDRAVVLTRMALAEVGQRVEATRVAVLQARLADYLWEAGDGKAAVAAYEEGHRLIANDSPSADKARVLAAYAKALMEQGQYQASRVRCEEAVAVARSVGARAQEGHALVTLGCDLWLLGHLEAGIAALQQGRALAEEAGTFEDILRAYSDLSAGLGSVAGRLEDALEVSRQGLARLRELGLEQALPGNVVRGDMAWALWLLGDWRQAEELASDVLTRELPPRWALHMQLTLGRIYMARGQFDLAQAKGEIAVRIAGELTESAFVQQYLAELATWQGDYGAARSAVARGLRDLAGSEETSVALWLCNTGLRAEADAAQQAHDRRDAAEFADIRAAGERLLVQARQLLAAVGHEGSLFDGGAEAIGCEAEFSRLERPSDPQRWATAVAAWDGLPRPYNALYARWRQVEALLGAKAPKEAAGVLRRAHQAAINLEARALQREIEGLARRARIDLQRRPPKPRRERAYGSPPATALGLTPREQDVLEHLVEGRTNRQIARALFISEKTASVHVSNIMSKLGAANRSEAAAIAHRLRLREPNA
jgi:DNA-binding CsgD family transcriptional regulator/tetratricopeptide (TPR) repeat protein